MRKDLRLPLQQLVSPYGDDLGPVEVYLSRAINYFKNSGHD